MTATMTKHAIDRDSLNNLTAEMAEWLKAERSEGMSEFEKLSFPVRTEETWRRTNPKLVKLEGKKVVAPTSESVSYTHLTLPTIYACRSRWSPYH